MPVPSATTASADTGSPLQASSVQALAFKFNLKLPLALAVTQVEVDKHWQAQPHNPH
jgi:hypothetical protein